VTEHHDQSHELPGPSLWPIGFAIGLACVLVGLVISFPVMLLGAVIALAFGVLWVRDLFAGPSSSAAVAEETSGAGVAAPDGTALASTAAAPAHVETYDRGAFLSVATVGVGAAIGAAVTLPVLGFAVLPSFTGAGIETFDVDLGPISNFPEGTYVIATFLEDPEQGEVTRRTAFVRNNGFTEDGVPSFTTLFSRCVHLGCPVQPNGPIDEEARQDVNGVELRPVLAASFGCPCHGGLYDGEGNRTAGPPVRSLDRFEFSIKNGNLVLGRLFSVGDVEGTGAKAKIMRYYQAYPGVHVDGPEKWLYPIPTPGSR
jgi:menaquinol-cytochrome c reductase iron-sulfur subunit